eukprot:m.42879 g.42879  ORF g.42879 m.42879 type:complete len:915 (+) comp7082_c0_seq1:71-2815(+)
MNADTEFDDIVGPPPMTKEGFSSESIELRPIEKVISRSVSRSESEAVLIHSTVDELDDASSDEEAQDDAAVRKRVYSSAADSRRATLSMASKPRPHAKASKHCTNTDHLIDFIFVAKLPDEEEREGFMEKANLPPSEEEENEVKCIRKRRRFLQALEEEGFEVEREVAPDNETVFFKVHCHFDRAMKQAELIKLKKTLKPNASSQLLEALDESSLSDKVLEVFSVWHYFKFLNPNVEEEPDSFSADFRVEMRNDFVGSDDESTFFTTSERSALVWDILQRVSYGPKVTQTGIKKLLANGTFSAAFPLHDGPYESVDSDSYDIGLDRNDRKTLYDTWGQLKKSFYFQPYDLIKRYFGVKIGLYFAWLGYYTISLIIPGILGFIVFINGLVNYRNRPDTVDVCNSTIVMCPLCDSGCEPWNLSTVCDAWGQSYWFDNEATIFFAIFMSLWGSVFIDFWKRRNAELIYEWDVMDFDDEEPNRPQFKGTELRKNPITGKDEKFYPTRKRIAKQFGGLATMVMMCFMVLVIVFSVIVYRIAVRAAIFAHNGINAQQASTYTAISAAALNLVGIILMNQLYQRIAVKLTDWENYQKESQYEAALTFKIFLFSFVNSFASIFYIAFFKGKFAGRPGAFNTIFGFRQDECPPYGCMLELTIQLVIIMVGRQVINNIVEMLLPTIKRMMAKFFAPKELKEKSKQLFVWEKEYLELAPLPQFGLFHEYLEMIIQYGFLTLFVSAFSLAPFFALLNNILEIRIDANKFLTVYRRIPGLRANDIGIWDEVMEFLSYFSVLTNGLVISFSSNFIPREVWRVAHNGMLVGYINAIHPLSPVMDMNSNFYGCHYFGLQESDGSRGQFYYEVLAARLGFLIIFEHFIFMSKYLIQAAIPDVPKSITLAIKREKYLGELAVEKMLQKENEQ